jgi:ubiquinone/menaquinone biosynthesis C-methylase UbiE
MPSTSRVTRKAGRRTAAAPAAKRRRIKRDTSPHQLTPEPLHQVMYSFVPSRVMQTALKLGVFAVLGRGAATADVLAAATKCDGRGMRMLLDALAACELASKKRIASKTVYAATPVSRQFLVPSSGDYIGTMFEHDTMWDTWQSLATAVRTGRPVQRVNDESVRANFFPTLVRSLHVINREPARRTAAELLGKGKARKRGLRVLDVACGSGVWGIALAEADRAAKVTGQDFQSTLNETRQYVEKHGLQDRYSYLPGDLNEVNLGTGEFDVVFLGHILHIEGEESSRRLLKRVSRALRPGGRVVIAEMVPDDARTGPPFPIFFALNMLLNTERGDTWTLAEYREWLQSAGFSNVKAVNVFSHSPVIIATKSKHTPNKKQTSKKREA